MRKYKLYITQIISIITLAIFMFSQAALGSDYLRNMQVREADTEAGLAGAIGNVDVESIINEQVLRFLIQNNLPQITENITAALEYVRTISALDVFSPDTTVLNIENSLVGGEVWTDERYDALAKQAEAASVSSYKGSRDKAEILDKLADAGTICFLGHGGKTHIWLTGGAGSAADSSDMHNPAGISFEEMAERLNGNEIIILDCCFARPLGQNIIDYRKQRGMNKMPCIISVSHGKTTSSFIDDIATVYGRRTDGLTMQDIFIAASRNEEVSIRLPVDEEILSRFAAAAATGEEFEDVLAQMDNMDLRLVNAIECFFEINPMSNSIYMPNGRDFAKQMYDVLGDWKNFTDMDFYAFLHKVYLGSDDNRKNFYRRMRKLIDLNFRTGNKIFGQDIVKRDEFDESKDPLTDVYLVKGNFHSPLLDYVYGNIDFEGRLAVIIDSDQEKLNAARANLIARGFKDANILEIIVPEEQAKGIKEGKTEHIRALVATVHEKVGNRKIDLILNNLNVDHNMGYTLYLMLRAAGIVRQTSILDYDNKVRRALLEAL